MEQLIVIVLGMHKSGTTLISQILHKSGINMGNFDERISYDQGNQYERYETQILNKEILKCGDTHSLDVIHPVTDITNEYLLKRMSLLVQDLCQKYSAWGFKDPRTCLTYPVWQKVLPPHKVIIVYRNPLEVYHHYRRGIPFYRIFKKLKYSYKALRAWYIYNSLLLQYISQLNSDYIVINFSEFMSSSRGLKKLESFLNIPLVDCRRKDLYRAKPKKVLSYYICSKLLAINYHPSVINLYEKLQKYTL